jgi:rifampicin phosphotransferase
MIVSSLDPDLAVANSKANLGGKAGNLIGLQQAGLPVPPWLVILPDASVRERCASSGDVFLSEELARRVGYLVRQLFGCNASMAVRSSGIDEDGGEHSFAGQLDSFLFVSEENLAEKVAQVWKSGFSERILAYRRERNLPGEPSLPAVLIQQMVDADAAGVAFSADPVSGRRGVTVISSCWGLGSGLVSGECDADLYHVDRGGALVLQRIAHKESAHRAARASREGVAPVKLSADLARQPSLTENQALRVAELARAAAQHFGRPQDVEWVLKENEIYLVQSRPITSLGGLGDPDGPIQIWDNSNIAESYSGVTTPLTFSFARRIYEEVYRQFCKIMGVPAPKVLAASGTFSRMLGLIRGRVYYNLVSWYRVLALLPGFTINRAFMEQMMGVKEPMPKEVLDELAPSADFCARLRDAVDLIGTVLGLGANHLRLPAMRRAFYGRLNEALCRPVPALELRRADELAAHYHELERQLLTRWDAPLVNDFFAMIFHGLLRNLCEKWCALPSLHNDLIAGDGDIISADPPKRIRQMAQHVAQDSQMVNMLCLGSPDAIQRAIKADPTLATLYHEYLERYGDRCLEELKLETLTLHDDPLLLLRAVGALARRIRESPATPERGEESSLRDRAQSQVALALRGHPFRAWVFRWVLGQARARVRDRENLRFERTRLFGRVRRIFVEIGKRFAAENLLNEPRDVFYLTLEEILGAIDGTAASYRLRDLAELRKREFAEYERSEAPPDRFETRGSLAHLTRFSASARSPRDPAPDPSSRNQLEGTGCYPGVVRARARVVTDPRQANLEPGEILVAPRTDPGWIMFFANAAGLLVEHGSVLSHSAIVAREMGIPAIVAIPGVTTWAKTGDMLELDGSTGTVRKLESNDDAK